MKRIANGVRGYIRAAAPSNGGRSVFGLTLTQQVAALFSAGEQGIWLDPSDFSTMFQDSAGTTFVTAVEQPVGLILDKSKDLVLGAEKITNGTFDTVTTGWVAGTNITLSVDTQRLKVVYGGSASQGASQTVSGLTVGRTYKLQFTFTQGNVPTNNIYLNAFAGLAGQGGYTASGTYTFYFTATATSGVFEIRTAGTWATNDYFFLDNITLKELAGNHASQATATSRPVLKIDGGYKYDLFDGVDDFRTTAAGGGSTTSFFMCKSIVLKKTGAAQTLFSDTGTNTGYRVRINASNQLEFSAGNGTAYTTVNTTATLALDEKAVLTCWHDGVNLNAQINNGTVAQTAFATATAGTAAITIGRDNGAATGYFGGGIYADIYVKNDACTAAERTSAKAYCASKAGITL